MKTSKTFQNTGGLYNPFKYIRYKKPGTTNYASKNNDASRREYEPTEINIFITNIVQQDLNKDNKSENTLLELEVLLHEKNFKELQSAVLIKYDENSLKKNELKKINESKIIKINTQKYDENATRNAVTDYNKKIDDINNIKQNKKYETIISDEYKLTINESENINVLQQLFANLQNKSINFPQIKDKVSELEKTLKFNDLKYTLKKLRIERNALFKLKQNKVLIPYKVIEKKQPRNTKNDDLLHHVVDNVIKGIVSAPESINKPVNHVRDAINNIQHVNRQQSNHSDILNSTLDSISDKWNKMNHNTRNYFSFKPVNRNPNNILTNAYEAVMYPRLLIKNGRLGIGLNLTSKGGKLQNAINDGDSFESILFALLSAIHYIISNKSPLSFTFAYYSESINKVSNVLEKKEVQLRVSKENVCVYLILKFHHLYNEYVSKAKLQKGGKKRNTETNAKKSVSKITKRVNAKTPKKPIKKTLSHIHAT
jgi:hypothetical protein